MNVRRGLAALALVLRARAATAEESHAFRLSYSAPAGCPTREAFLAAIESNSARAHRARAGEAAIEINALVAPEGGGFLGVLRIRRPDGTETTRSVPAATCSEAASAMALIATIAIDPDAASGAPSGDAVPSQTGAASAPPVATTAPMPVPTPPPTNSGDETLSTATKNARPIERRWWLGADAGIGLASGLAPRPSADFSLGMGVGATQKTLLSPIVLLSGHLAESPTASNQEGTARFQRLAGRITGCPLKLDAAPFSFRPCALFEVGELRAKGTNAENHATVSVPILWLALGATMRGELHLVGPLTLAGEAGALLPLVRDSFYFNPSGTTLYKVGDVGFVGALELGVQFL